MIKLRHLLENLQPPSVITTDPKYDDFFTWLMRFQNQKTSWVDPKFKDFKDEIDLMDRSKRYVLYRGLFFKSPSKEIKNLKVGDIIIDSGTSWSINYDTAIQFARNDHYFGGGKDLWIEGKSRGIIIQHNFGDDEILCDLNYMYEKGFKRVEYPKEKEVIVFKAERRCKIVEIMDKRLRNRRDIK